MAAGPGGPAPALDGPPGHGVPWMKMFERYTEQARRVVFFARYEASVCGGDAIDSGHLLLGLLREGQGLAGRILRCRSGSSERAGASSRWGTSCGS